MVVRPQEFLGGGPALQPCASAIWPAEIAAVTVNSDTATIFRWIHSVEV